MKLKANYSLMSFGLMTASAALLAVGWLSDELIVGDNLGRRVVLVFIAFAISLGAIWSYLGRQAKYRKSAQRYLDLLCRVDANDISGNLADVLPTLAEDNPWHSVFTRVRDCIQLYNDRLHEAEHNRACADVRSRRAVAEIEQRNSILNGLTEPVVAIDAYDEIVLTNPSAERLLNIQSANTETRALDRLVECETLVNLLVDTRRRKTPTQRTGELTLPDSTGMQRTYRVTCRSIANLGDDKEKINDVAHGAVAVLNDITNEKLIQKRNAEFVSAVSHEMKTPLSGIKAYVELLVDGDAETEEQREEFLNVIEGQADRLQRLVENLLNLARIEAGVVEVNKTPRSLNELLNEALGVVQPTAQQKNITLVDDISPLYLGVLADRDMLLQAAINLLSNAIKYTHAGGKVTLRSRMDDRDVVFEVEDTGVGLNPEDCDKVFEKFYRVKKDTNMAPGTGLGLPLAKHIVEDVHGGRLTLKSEPGKGSTFRITLPSAGRMNEK